MSWKHEHDKNDLEHSEYYVDEKEAKQYINYVKTKRSVLKPCCVPQKLEKIDLQQKCSLCGHKDFKLQIDDCYDTLCIMCLGCHCIIGVSELKDVFVVAKK